ncbi:MAG: ferritin-like protein [Actinomycetota bacterium]|nr:ferritin-like protein [Actinomycetota bacterium]
MLFLQPQLAERLDEPAALLDALQQAVKLEHSTLPPYLYARWSLVDGANDDIADIIGSVAGEEMLHMALACNILNAIGGSPVIDHPDFVPTYPGPLPGSVESGLVVPLEPLSIDLVKDVFMVIEEPEEPLDFRVAGEGPPDKITIGEFYGAIREQMDAATFDGPPDRQVTTPLIPELHEVRDADSAKAAIDLIVEQGEGTTTSPLGGDGFAHYYRFAEIANGRRLVPNPHPDPHDPDSDYSYSGEPLTLDPGGVLPLAENPTPAAYAGTAAEQWSANFDYTYTAMLKALHAAFNGQPGQLGPAIGLMDSCKQQALSLREIVLPDGTCAGPTFTYRPTNP